MTKEVRYKDLTRELKIAYNMNWNADGGPASWDMPGEYFEFTSRPHNISGWLSTFKEEYFQDRLRLEQIYGGYYEHMDYCVWRNIHRVVQSHKDTFQGRTPAQGADIGCQNGLYPAMMLHQGVQEVTIFEIRDNVQQVPNVIFTNKDLTYDTSINNMFDLVTSASTIEHIGLGRYGDPIDPDGDIKMMNSIHRILRPGGHAIISFPYQPNPNGRGMIVWNHHRIYNKFRKDLLFKDFQIVKEEDVGDFQPTWLLRKA